MIRNRSAGRSVTGRLNVSRSGTVLHRPLLSDFNLVSDAKLYSRTATLGNFLSLLFIGKNDTPELWK